MEFLEFLGTGTGAILITKLMDFMLTRRKMRKHTSKQDAFYKGMSSVSEVLSAASSLKQLTSVQRVLILEVTNGGDLPKPGSVMYARAIHVKEADFKTAQVLTKAYENLRIDDDYIRMCLQAASSSDPYRFKVAEHADCLLKDIYNTEKILYSEIYHLYTDVERKKMFVMSISTHDADQYFTEASDRSTINLKISEIRNNFNQFSKVINNQ